MSIWERLRNWFRPEPRPVPIPPEPDPFPGDWLDELLAAHNRERGARGLAPLAYSKQLEVAAMRQAAWMYTNGTLSHTGYAGNTVADRVSDTGFRWVALGENIAYGQPTVADVMRSWFTSQGHRANILSSKFRQIGCARAGAYWCIVFALEHVGPG